MRLLYQPSTGHWAAESSYDERQLPKQAGFGWDPANRRWWTDDWRQAAKLRRYATPAADAAIAAQEQAHDAVVAASRARDATIDLPVPAGLAYLPFQRAGIATLLGRPSALLGDDPGLGKTVQALGLVNADPSIQRILVVCPATVKLVWARHAERWLVHPRPIRVLNGGTTVADDGGPCVVIVNFDVLPKHAAALRARGEWDLLVVDEAHYIKNPTARRTVEVLGHRHRDPAKHVEPIPAHRRLFLTGTPLPNRPAELWPLLQSLDPTGLGRSWFRFHTRYCGARQQTIRARGGSLRTVWDTGGATNLEELQDLLRSSVLVRRLKADVLAELPAKRRQTVSLEPPTEIARRDAELQARHGDLLARLTRDADWSHLLLAAGDTVAFEEITALRHDTALAKVPLVVEHLRGYVEAETKVVLFGHHHDVLDAISAELGQAAVQVDGRTPLADRQAAIDRFQNDPACLVFVGSIGAAGTGITLTAAAHVVFAELDWVPGNMSQAEDRCILEGQKVLTPGGWRPVETIAVGDAVVTRSGVGRVTDAWHRSNTKPVTEVSVEGWLEPIATTSDHPFLLADGGWQEAGHLKPGDQIAMPKASGKRVASVSFDTDCRIASEFTGARGQQRNGRLLKAPEHVLLTDDALFTFGYFVGDGFSSIVAGKGRFISFAGHQVKKIAAHDRCRRWCELQGMHVSMRRSSGLGMEMRAFSGEWALWFRKQFGHTAIQKRLPEFLLSLDVAQSQVLLDGLIASDGYRRNGYVEYVTSSNQLASQVARIVLATGRIPTIRMTSTDQFVVGFSEAGHGTAGLVRRVTHRFPHKSNGRRERVYDLTVDADPTFVVGLSVVHNCHRIGQHDAVLVQHLVFDGTIDDRLLGTLVAKQKVIDRVLDRVPEATTTTDDHQATAPEARPPRGEATPTTAPLSATQAAAVLAALRYLAGHDADRAAQLNGVGFSRYDTDFGHELATRRELTPRQAAAGRKLALRYRRQLPEQLLADLAVPS